MIRTKRKPAARRTATRRRATPYARAMRRAEDAFSRFIRARGGNKCELHARAKELGYEMPCKCGGEMVCYHIVPKSRGLIFKFDPFNAICACSGANTYEYHNRDVMRDVHWHLFPGWMKELINLPRKPFKYTVAELDKITETCDAEVKRMEGV